MASSIPPFRSFLYSFSTASDGSRLVHTGSTSSGSAAVNPSSSYVHPAEDVQTKPIRERRGSLKDLPYVCPHLGITNRATPSQVSSRASLEYGRNAEGGMKTVLRSSSLSLPPHGSTPRLDPEGAVGDKVVSKRLSAFPSASGPRFQLLRKLGVSNPSLLSTSIGGAAAAAEGQNERNSFVPLSYPPNNTNHPYCKKRDEGGGGASKAHRGRTFRRRRFPLHLSCEASCDSTPSQTSATSMMEGVVSSSESKVDFPELASTVHSHSPTTSSAKDVDSSDDISKYLSRRKKPPGRGGSRAQSLPPSAPTRRPVGLGSSVLSLSYPREFFLKERRNVEEIGGEEESDESDTDDFQGGGQSSSDCEFQLSLLDLRNRDDFRVTYLKKLSYANVWVPQSRRPPSHQTVIIFDWDDTLLCTSYINRKSEIFSTFDLADESKEESPVRANIRRQIRLIESYGKSLLETAQRIGRVFIITNAMEGWVEFSAKRYLPSLLPALSKISIISARQRYESCFPGECHQWKIQAFLEVQRSLNNHIITNLISIGDSNMEMDAVLVMGRGFSHALIKTIKFRESPTPDELAKQLELVGQKFDKICMNARNLKIGLERKYGSSSSGGARGGSGSSTRKKGATAVPSSSLLQRTSYRRSFSSVALDTAAALGAFGRERRKKEPTSLVR